MIGLNVGNLCERFSKPIMDFGRYAVTAGVRQ